LRVPRTSTDRTAAPSPSMSLFQECVDACDEVEFRVLIDCSERFNGIDRIGFPLALDLDVRCLECGFPTLRYGPSRASEQLMECPLPVCAEGYWKDEQYPVEFQPFADLLSCGEVAIVDGLNVPPRMPSLRTNMLLLNIILLKCCHCEECSDEAISFIESRLHAPYGRSQ